MTLISGKLGVWQLVVPGASLVIYFKGQLGVPLTVYPWYLLCSTSGFLGINPSVDDKGSLPLFQEFQEVVMVTYTLENRHETQQWRWMEDDFPFDFLEFF